jgi:hypothetical protein
MSGHKGFVAVYTDGLDVAVGYLIVVDDVWFTFVADTVG